MVLSEYKKWLESMNEISFQLPDGTSVPSHFHITEVGLVDKSFVDCGGVKRQEKFISFQLWFTSDVAHRLEPSKVLSIISKTEKQITLPDEEIEIEYQSDTIGKYSVDFQNGIFLLKAKQTKCLAPDLCDIPTEKQKPRIRLTASGEKKVISCDPNSGCC